jgi:hypothetical protein
MLMLKGSIQLGQVPAFALNFDLMPVDFSPVSSPSMPAVISRKGRCSTCTTPSR